MYWTTAGRFHQLYSRHPSIDLSINSFLAFVTPQTLKAIKMYIKRDCKTRMRDYTHTSHG